MTTIPVEPAPKATPLDRLTMLCDPGSIQLIRSGVEPAAPMRKEMPGDGVVAASGHVDGRPIFCYAQDKSCAGGSLGAAGAWTILRVLQLADRAQCPVVGFVESAGARMQEGVAALGGYARIFRQIVAMRDRVPQVSVVCGLSAGGGAYAPALTDFVIMVRSGAMFLTGPRVVKMAIGETVSNEELGGPRVHERNGVSHLVADDDRHGAELARALLGYLPQRAGLAAPFAVDRDAPDGDALTDLVPAESRKIYDMRKVIEAIVDRGSVLELSPKWARNVLTSYARIDGRPVGIVANQPRFRGGVLDAGAAQKASRFVDTCSAYGTPIVVLVDTTGFMPGRREEAAGVIHHGSELIRAFADASVPRFTVVLRKAYGGAYITMNCKDLGAHFTFGWPGAEIGVMAAKSATTVLNGSGPATPISEEQLSVAAAARRGYIDEVIEPSSTRERLARALSMFGGAPDRRRQQRT